MSRLLALFGLLLLGFVGSGAAHPATAAVDAAKLRVYAFNGFDALTLLPNPEYQADFEKGSVKGAAVTWMTKPKGTESKWPGPAKAAVLTNLAAADIVFASLHSADNIETSGGTYASALALNEKPKDPSDSGWKLGLADFAALRQQRGESGLPRLFIVVGCSTALKPEAAAKHGIDPKATIPGALGYSDGLPGRAYIGFDIPTTGVKGDSLVLWFLKMWTNDRPSGGYQTLGEVLKELGPILKNFTSSGAKRPNLDPGAANFLDNMVIVGDQELRFSDLMSGR